MRLLLSLQLPYSLDYDTNGSERRYSDLAAGYRAYVDWLAVTIRPLFWSSSASGLRCVTIIGNVSLGVFDPAQSYTPDGDCILDDPYEGELMSGITVLTGSKQLTLFLNRLVLDTFRHVRVRHDCCCVILGDHETRARRQYNSLRLTGTQSYRNYCCSFNL